MDFVSHTLGNGLELSPTKAHSIEKAARLLGLNYSQRAGCECLSTFRYSISLLDPLCIFDLVPKPTVLVVGNVRHIFERGVRNCYWCRVRYLNFPSFAVTRGYFDLSKFAHRRSCTHHMFHFQG